MSDTEKVAINPITWIASYPKSGNTWVRAFLQALMAETGLIPRDDVTINTLGKFLPGDISTERFEAANGKSEVGLSDVEVMEGRLNLQRSLAASYKHPLFVKTHTPLGSVAGVATHDLKLSKGAIYLIRNPLDVLASYANHSAMRITDMIRHMSTFGYVLAGTTERAKQYRGSWTEHVESWTGSENKQTLVMRYEDMLADPVKEFTRLVHHTGLKATPEQIETAVKATSIDVLRQQEDEQGFLERRQQGRFFGKGQADGWRSAISKVGVKVMVEVHARQMSRFGYLTDEVLEFAGMKRADALKVSTQFKKRAMAQLAARRANAAAGEGQHVA